MNTQEILDKIDDKYEKFLTKHDQPTKKAHGEARKILGEVLQLIKLYRKTSVAEDKAK